MAPTPTWKYAVGGIVAVAIGYSVLQSRRCRGQWFTRREGDWYQVALRDDFPGLVTEEDFQSVTPGDEFKMAFVPFETRESPGEVIVVPVKIYRDQEAREWEDRLVPVASCHLRTQFIFQGLRSRQMYLRHDYEGTVGLDDIVR